MLKRKMEMRRKAVGSCNQIDIGSAQSIGSSELMRKRTWLDDPGSTRHALSPAASSTTTSRPEISSVRAEMYAGQRDLDKARRSNPLDLAQHSAMGLLLPLRVSTE